MKKFIPAILAFCLLLCFNSCQKLEKTLEGTVWEGPDTITLTFGDGTCVLSFSSIGGERAYYSYEYDFPTVYLYPEDDGLAMLKGIISSSKMQMNLINNSTLKTIGTFVKKK